MVQVKSGTASASNEEVKRLRSSAKKKVAKALVMKVNDKNIKSRIVY